MLVVLHSAPEVNSVDIWRGRTAGRLENGDVVGDGGKSVSTGDDIMEFGECSMEFGEGIIEVGECIIGAD